MKKTYLYKSKLDYLDTQKGISMILDEISHFLKNNLNLIKIRSPKYFHESESIFDENDFSYSRKINFDSITDYSVYKIYNNYDNWMFGKLLNLSVKNNNGLFSFVNYLNRDEQEFGIKTFERNEIVIFFHYENNELLEDKIMNFSMLFFNFLLNLKKKANSLFKELTGIYPKKIDIMNLNNEEKAKLDNTNVNDLKKYFLQKSKWNIFIYNIENKKNANYSLSTYLDKLKKAIDILVISYFSNEKISYFKINIDLDLICMIILEKLFIYEIQSNINNSDIQKILVENKITDI